MSVRLKECEKQLSDSQIMQPYMKPFVPLALRDRPGDKLDCVSLKFSVASVFEPHRGFGHITQMPLDPLDPTRRRLD